FERLRASSYATTFSQTYLEQGRYAEAIASTGAETSLVNPQTPDVAFANVTRDVVSAAGIAAGTTVTLFDVDGDGDLDLAAGGTPSLRLYRNDSSRLTDISTAAFGTQLPADVSGAVAGDYDND